MKRDRIFAMQERREYHLLHRQKRYRLPWTIGWWKMARAKQPTAA